MADNIEQRVAHRYMKDRDGETYFPITHVDALIGLEQFDDSEYIKKVEEKVDRAERNIKIVDENNHNLEDSFKDFIGVTNWTSYANDVAPGVQTNTAYSSDGLKCEVKEVRIGVTGLTPIVRYKTIAYNLRNFKLGEQVAQLPVGFMTKPHSFPAYGNGNMGAYRVEVTKSGAMTIFGGLNDKNLDTSSYWVYGQYTWIE
ncbi:hypothetical protein [Mammaliicoccus sp. R-M63]|uniref:hypothetical protein n=1 Tax=Mammaliicoccus sp. R-M63 TaxID=2898722 RepID=UPI001EFB07CE|nr:hypothetical protein [Mammaliicoccus sp. R-M63]